MDQPMLNLDINQEEHRGRTAVLTLLLPAMLVLVLLLVLVGLRDGAEGALARLVDLLPVSYAFAAGMVASVNPCGVLMGALGVWLLTGHRTLGIAAAGRVRITPARNLGNMFLFGIVYAIGSLSCTLPVFLVVVGSALSGGSAAASFGQFLGYALGMGSVILAVTVGTALFRRTISRWLDRLTPYVHRFSSLFLIGAGGYLVFYWIFIAGIG